MLIKVLNISFGFDMKTMRRKIDQNPGDQLGVYYNIKLKKWCKVYLEKYQWELIAKVIKRIVEIYKCLLCTMRGSNNFIFDNPQ